MDVSIIMINYNTFDLAKDAIESIKKHTTGVKYEIILVDNLSPDGSGDKLKEYFKDEIIYIQSGGNLGTSKAFNLGLKKATGKYVLWLNSDILIYHDFITELYKYMENNPNCGISGGNVVGFDGKPAHSFRRELTTSKTVRKDKSIIRAVFRKLFKKKLSSEYNFTNNPLSVGYITGADMMIRSSVISKIGGFDERIYMYAEETEFTYRVKREGFEVVCVPSAEIKHLEGASFNGKTRFSERRCKLIIEGVSRYIFISYGQKETIKYLKTIKRTAVKHIILKAILGKKESLKIEKCNRKVAKEFLNKLKLGKSIFEL